MKCISCGSEIAEGMTSCPFCGNTVLPANHNVVSQENQANAGLPITPETPVLPQDQNLTMQNSTPMANDTSSIQDTGVQNNQQPNIGVQPEMAQGSVTDVASTDVSTPSVVSTPMPESVMGAPMVSNQGEIGDGMKIASTAAPVIEKKGNKKVLIAVLVAIVVLAIAGGIGGYYYMSQYKSADKRIDAVFSGMSKFASGLKADKVEMGSGTYEFGASVTYGDTSLEGKVNGTYAYDLEKRLMDYTLNVSTLGMKMQGEELNLIDKEPLKLELYTADSKAYILLENFYENYIYMDVQGYDELFDGIEQNDINYSVILQGYISAIKSGLKATTNTQTVKEVAIDGKTEKANVVTIVLNEGNQKILVERMINSLKNNTNFLEEMAKLSNTTADEIKSSLDEYSQDISYIEKTWTMDIITNIKGSELLAINVFSDNKSLELVTIENGMKISVKEDNKSICDLTYTSTNVTSSTAEEISTNVELTGYFNDQVLKVSFESKIVNDINPKVEKINTKNSISAENISVEDQQKILENICDFGTLGLMLQSYLGGMITVPNESNNIGYGYDYQGAYESYSDMTINPSL